MHAANYALMPESALSVMLKQCSRSAPHASGSWTPTREQLDQLERHLPQLAGLAERQGMSPRDVDPKASFRQYLGVIVDNRHFIYVNAIAASDLKPPYSPDPHIKPVIVCDGGSAFWGVLYDPDTKTFSQLDANGAI
ncbi:MAG TPA: hypothetical protein VGG00_00960 [Rhodanobacter sp.]|jgi:hypothetical protein